MSTWLIILCLLSAGINSQVYAADEPFVGKSPLESDSTDFDIPAGAPPAPFINLANAVRFVQAQRGLGGSGLPATFYVPAGVTIADPQRELIIKEGVGLYDTALAILVLIEAGDLQSAREILDVYRQGSYSMSNPIPMELRAYPMSANGGAFSSFDEKVHYFFDFTNVRGDWERRRTNWEFWAAHTGPNAWLLNALVRYIDASRRHGQDTVDLQPYIALARMLGDAMIRLQDRAALGGVRYGPKDEYAIEGEALPFDQINSENNISAYVAFNMLYKLTGDQAYQKAAQHIVDWFKNASVWTETGTARKGLYDPESGTLAMGAEFEKGHWILQKDHPTDSGGTWTISCLGPEKIDELWGPKAAYKMWHTIRQRAGRTVDCRWVGRGRALAGLDYTDTFPENESLISPEWTAGGLYALDLLIHYYSEENGKGLLTTQQLDEMKEDVRTMSAFIRRNPNPYALGPGHGGKRQGATGFKWFAPPPEVTAMASVYCALYFANKPDPSAWWRLHQKTRVQKIVDVSSKFAEN